MADILSEVRVSSVTLFDQMGFSAYPLNHSPEEWDKIFNGLWRHLSEAMYALDQFRIYIPDGATGLDVGVRPGTYIWENEYLTYAGTTSYALTDNQVNYLWITFDAAGAATLNKGASYPAATSGALRLGTIETDSGAIKNDPDGFQLVKPQTVAIAPPPQLVSLGDALLKDGSVELTANWDAGSFQIIAETFQSDVATGTAPLTVASTTVVANLNADKIDGTDVNDAGSSTADLWTANKIQAVVDAAVNGLSWKADVVCRATGDVDLAGGGLANGTTHDGVTVATGERVACFDQATGSQDGVYIVPASGAASRSTDFPAAAACAGYAFRVNEGSTHGDLTFYVTNDAGSDIVDTDALTLAGGSGGGESNTASNVGTDGIGVFYQKTGVDLEFKNIAPASSKVTVVANGQDIDIDIDEGQLSASADTGHYLHAVPPNQGVWCHYTGAYEKTTLTSNDVDSQLYNDIYVNSSTFWPFMRFEDARVAASGGDIAYVCMVYRAQLPSDFDDTLVATSDAISIDFRTEENTTTNNSMSVRVRKLGTAGTVDATGVASAVAETWDTIDITKTSLQTLNLAADDEIVIEITCKSNASRYVDLGAITLKRA